MYHIERATNNDHDMIKSSNHYIERYETGEKWLERGFARQGGRRGGGEEGLGQEKHELCISRKLGHLCERARVSLLWKGG